MDSRDGLGWLETIALYLIQYNLYCLAIKTIKHIFPVDNEFLEIILICNNSVFSAAFLNFQNYSFLNDSPSRQPFISTSLPMLTFDTGESHI